MNVTNLKKAIKILQHLADGVHPYTQERISPADACNDERVIQWLNYAIEQLNNVITAAKEGIKL
jgi:hypothetical protein